MLKQTTGETRAIYFASELATCVIPQQQVTIDRHNVTGGYIGSRNGSTDIGVHLVAMGLRLWTANSKVAGSIHGCFGVIVLHMGMHWLLAVVAERNLHVQVTC